MLKTNLFSIVLGSLQNCCFGMNWDAFASTYLDDTYIGPTSSSNMIPNAQWYVHLCHHPKRSFERDFFKKLSNGIWRYFGRASSWSLQCPFLLGWQCRPLRLSVAISEESQWFRVLFSKSICAINQMTQKNDYWWLIVALDTVMCFYSFYNSYKLFMQESVKSYSAVFWSNVSLTRGAGSIPKVTLHALRLQRPEDNQVLIQVGGSWKRGFKVHHVSNFGHVYPIDLRYVGHLVA